MSLLPQLLDLWDSSCTFRPSRILDQHFGLALDPEDFWQPLTVPRFLVQSPAGYIRNWRSPAFQQDTGSTVSSDKNKFQAYLDVQQFKPEEISVKLIGDNVVTVEGKHEEKQDEHGQIYRHFVRRYMLPKNCDISKIESKLSSDGVLTLSVPIADKEKSEEKAIPITQTGEPCKTIEKRCEKNPDKKCGTIHIDDD